MRPVIGRRGSGSSHLVRMHLFADRKDRRADGRDVVLVEVVETRDRQRSAPLHTDFVRMPPQCSTALTTARVTRAGGRHRELVLRQNY